ncbi:hypothetical protein ACFQZO_07245 [Bradyrhizobium sp. GCM10027634]|uniref:hypothetical protein n=1 Tax=unclassified Bradyrhizobium TaxID=2631580 RepID=UPI00188B414C|nr:MULTISPECIES: hypothetical protein [unclassified Bradyrhizobium]MDN5000672.1 hypothetical protein [Bradyrhizobium sp. WYCCWR 12677]QOZ42603.1 hypothetical protein XH89_03285 [Bradyrhizobium sp. CCBAU 53340]
MNELSPEASKFITKLYDARGATLLAFAQVEWFLAKLIVEAASFEQYQALDLSFSHDAGKRAERLKTILNVDGPFSPYADELRTEIGQVMSYEELRNFSAHGMLIRPDPNDTSLSSPIHLRMFQMFKGGQLVELKKDTTLKAYTDDQEALAAAANRFMTTVKAIWKDLNLKELEAS